jgi:hypothetical protein
VSWISYYSYYGILSGWPCFGFMDDDCPACDNEFIDAVCDDEVVESACEDEVVESVNRSSGSSNSSGR